LMIKMQNMGITTGKLESRTLLVLMKPTKEVWTI
jgi:hypothetical protein